MFHIETQSLLIRMPNDLMIILPLSRPWKLKQTNKTQSGLHKAMLTRGNNIFHSKRLDRVNKCACVCVCTRAHSLDRVSAPGHFWYNKRACRCSCVWVWLAAMGGQFLERTFTIFFQYDRISCCWRRSSNEIFSALWFGGSSEQIWQPFLQASFRSFSRPSPEPRSPSAISTTEHLQLVSFLRVYLCY